MKKLIALLLAAVMCLSLVACGVGSGNETIETKGSEENTSNTTSEVETSAPEDAIIGEWTTLSGSTLTFNEDGTGTAPNGEFSWKYDTDTEWYLLSFMGITFSFEIETENDIHSISLEGETYYHAADYEKASENVNSTTKSSESNTEIDWKVQLCDREWYCVGTEKPIGMWFNADGTMSASTWELTDNKVMLTTSGGDLVTYEIRTINNIHFLVGITDGISYYQHGGADWNNLPITTIEITTDNWQDYLEIVSVSNDYHLKLKNAYRQALTIMDCDSRFSVCYSQGDENTVSREITFQWGNDYIVVENPEEVPLEIEKIEGTLYIIDGLL